MISGSFTAIDGTTFDNYVLYDPNTDTFDTKCGSTTSLNSKELFYSATLEKLYRINPSLYEWNNSTEAWDLISITGVEVSGCEFDDGIAIIGADADLTKDGETSRILLYDGTDWTAVSDPPETLTSRTEFELVGCAEITIDGDKMLLVHGFEWIDNGVVVPWDETPIMHIWDGTTWLYDIFDDWPVNGSVDLTTTGTPSVQFHPTRPSIDGEHVWFHQTFRDPDGSDAGTNDHDKHVRWTPRTGVAEGWSKDAFEFESKIATPQGTNFTHQIIVNNGEIAFAGVWPWWDDWVGHHDGTTWSKIFVPTGGGANIETFRAFDDLVL